MTNKSNGRGRGRMSSYSDEGPEKFEPPAPPIIASKGMEPMEEQIGQDGVVEMEEDRNGDAILVKPSQESVDDPSFTEKMANLEFMKDEITVHIQPTAEKNADKIFMVGVNGEQKVFERNKQYTVPRYFVEALARAKPTTFINEEYTKPDGTRAIRWPSQTGLRYPFSVIHDPHPRGPDWLKHVLAQP